MSPCMPRRRREQLTVTSQFTAQTAAFAGGWLIGWRPSEEAAEKSIYLVIRGHEKSERSVRG